MGGATSNLFYGTKGAQKEYQYTLFPNEKVSKNIEQVTVVSVGAMSETPKRVPYKQKILVVTIIEKCYEYYDGKLSAQPFVDWLKDILSDPLYSIVGKLRRLIETALQKLQQCLAEDSEQFTLLVQAFEKSLLQLQ